MKNNIKKYTILSLAAAIFLGSFSPALALKSSQDSEPVRASSGSVVKVVSASQTSSVKVSLADPLLNCSGFETGHLQGSVVNLNVPATCFSFVRGESKPVAMSVQVVSLRNNFVVKVVKKNTAVSVPAYQESVPANLPTLPAGGSELLFGVLLFGLVVRLNYGKKVSSQNLLFNFLTFNRFSVLRC